MPVSLVSMPGIVFIIFGLALGVSTSATLQSRGETPVECRNISGEFVVNHTKYRVISFGVYMVETTTLGITLEPSGVFEMRVTEVVEFLGKVLTGVIKIKKHIAAGRLVFSTNCSIPHNQTAVANGYSTSSTRSYPNDATRPRSWSPLFRVWLTVESPRRLRFVSNEHGKYMEKMHNGSWKGVAIKATPEWLHSTPTSEERLEQLDQSLLGIRMRML